MAANPGLMTLRTWKWPGFRWPGSRRSVAIARTADPWASPSRTEPVETPLTVMLSQMETAACAVYARHGLPDRPGQYARSPRARTWRFLSEDLTAEERWALILAQKDGSKWRFGSLEDLGDQADSPPDLRRASQVLKSCRQLRARLAEGGSVGLGEDLETAIGLGAAWRQLDTPPPVVLQRSEPLKLTMPSGPAPKKKTAPPKRTTRAKP